MVRTSGGVGATARGRRREGDGPVKDIVAAAAPATDTAVAANGADLVPRDGRLVRVRELTEHRWRVERGVEGKCTSLWSEGGVLLPSYPAAV